MATSRRRSSRRLRRNSSSPRALRQRLEQARVRLVRASVAYDQKGTKKAEDEWDTAMDAWNAILREQAALTRNSRTSKKEPPPEFPVNPSNGTLDLRRLVPRTESERHRMLAAVEVEHQGQLSLLRLAERGVGTPRGLLTKRLHALWEAADRLRTCALKR